MEIFEEPQVATDKQKTIEHLEANIRHTIAVIQPNLLYESV